jgi:hypothetical protein
MEARIQRGTSFELSFKLKLCGTQAVAIWGRSLEARVVLADKEHSNEERPILGLVCRT